uniref:Uncharacterized protein n=1 Tax=Ananas comosus var. bracteatus TaxID=296719 RepID=A0A6V7PVK9_ANACO|nr:unnamed protein product [Ananas comosus var. bracteatus]
MALTFQFLLTGSSLVLLCFSLWFSSWNTRIDGPTMTMFEDWMSEHGRAYANAKEKQQRYEIFKNNVKYIEGFNKVGGRSYTLGVNQFSDLTNEEFTDTYAVGTAEQDIPTDIETALVDSEYENAALRATVDWRTEGAVTEVKNQLGCGCCWAFSTVATVESIYKIKKGLLKSLSEQEVLDCSNGGDCTGGSRYKAFDFIDGTKNNEAELMKAVNDQPVAVVVNARPWQHYTGGIFDKDCLPDVTHAVVIVGYGEESGKKYWILKNSYGPKWGESGYMRIAKDVAAKEGLCVMAFTFQFFLMGSSLVLLCFSLWFSSWNTRIDGPTITMFEDWMSEHGRAYVNAKEKQQRYEIFKNNVKYIEGFNKVGGRSYTLGVNQFSDLTNEEFVKTYAAGIAEQDIPTDKEVCLVDFGYENMSLRATVDWRTRGAVTKVKNQGDCNSCWAFSVVTTVESIYKIKKGELKSLSEQQVLDCSDGGDCSGGSRLKAFRYIVANKGLTTEANYPYKASKGVCDKTKESDHAAYITGCRLVTRNNEAKLMKAVNNQPVAVAVNAGPWKHYTSGIFDKDCPPDVNHCAAIVGYGEESGKKYWILKNSYGPKWGESGYIRIAKDVAAKEGLCGIAKAPLYPYI